MFPDIADTVTKYGSILGKGFVAEMAPKIIKGALVDMLKEKGVNVKKATGWVEKDVCLWDTLDPKHQRVLVNLNRRVTNLDWLSSGWVIEAIKGDLPAVASLFLGWKKGRNWLQRQVSRIREEIAK